MTELRLAVVLFELFGRENVFSIRLGLVRHSILFLEGVDHQRAVDFQGSIAAGAVEHQPAAETPRGRVAGTL